MSSSRERVFLQFDQILNFMFRSAGNENAWYWKEKTVESAFLNFCRDATTVVARTELHTYAKQNWLYKNGLEKRPEVARSLVELLDSQIPLKI